jgi:HSP20 family protein
MALVRSDPFRDVDRMLQQFWSSQQAGVRQSMAMPMDAYRKGDAFLLSLDLPGVTPGSIELTVEDGVLTITAQRPLPPKSDDVEAVIAERPHGTFTRQVSLGSTLDTEHIVADYEAGVLTISIPVAEHAKPKRIEVTTRSDHQEITA